MSKRHEDLIETAREAARILVCTHWKIMANVRFRIEVTQNIEVVSMPVHRPGGSRTSLEVFPALEPTEDPETLRIHPKLVVDDPPAYVLKQLVFEAMLPVALEQTGQSMEDLCANRPKNVERAHRWLLRHGYPGVA